MKGVIASELILVLAMMVVLYLLWLHDEQLKELLRDTDQLRAAVGELSAPKPARAARAKPSTTNGKAD